jgi:hypothetical protein
MFIKLLSGQIAKQNSLRVLTRNQIINMGKERRVTMNFDFGKMEITTLSVNGSCDGSGGQGSGCDCDGQEGD